MIVCLVVWLFRGPDGRESRPLCSDVIFPFCTELVMMSEHDMQNRPDIIQFSCSTTFQESDYLKRLCMWPSRKRNTETGSGNSKTKVFSSMSWTREGPHMSTQAARVNHWWWEMGSCSVFLKQVRSIWWKEQEGQFLTAREMNRFSEMVIRTGVRKQIRKSKRK